MKRGAVAFVPSELALPCAYIRLPWAANAHYSRLIPPAEGGLKIVEDYINKTIVEEVCVDPPLYILRFGLNDVEDFDAFRRVLSPEQVMAIQHSLSSNQQELSFLGSCKCTILRANPEDPMLSSHRIFVVHHVLEPLSELPINYEGIEQLWVHNILTRLLNFINDPECLSHLVIFIDASQTMRKWYAEHMGIITHLISQVVAVVSSCLPLKLCKPTGAMTMQIVVLPCVAFSEGVNALRRENSELDRPPSSKWWFCRNACDSEEPQGNFPSREKAECIEYVGIPSQQMRDQQQAQYQTPTTRFRPSPELFNKCDANNHNKNTRLEQSYPNPCPGQPTQSSDACQNIRYILHQPETVSTHRHSSTTMSGQGFYDQPRSPISSVLPREICQEHRHNLPFIERGLQDHGTHYSGPRTPFQVAHHQVSPSTASSPNLLGRPNPPGNYTKLVTNAFQHRFTATPVTNVDRVELSRTSIPPPSNISA